MAGLTEWQKRRGMKTSTPKPKKKKTTKVKKAE